MADINMRILLSAVGASGVTSAIGSIASSLGGGGLTGALLGVGVAAVGAAVALGVSAVQAAASYQQAMVQLQNTTGSSDAQMQQYTATIQQLSNTTGIAQTNLASGMYQIISANFAGADATRILTTATQAAIIANADQTQVTTGLVVTLNAFGKKASQVDTISNQMFKTLALGRGNISDLSGALQTGASLVAHYGVSITDMDATLATLSTGGMKTFGTSMTALTQLLNVMDGKTDLIATRLHKLGINFDESKFKAMSYTQQIAYLNNAFKGNQDLMVSVLGSKQAATALGILGTQSKLLTGNIQKLSDAQALAKQKQDAWARTQQTFAFQTQLLHTTMQNLLITLGASLLPIITHVVSAVAPAIVAFAQWITKSNALAPVFATIKAIMTPVIGIFMQFIGVLRNIISWVQHNQTAMQAFKVLLIGLGAVIAVALIVPLIAITVILAAVALAIGVVVGIVMLVITVIQHWGDIMHWFGGIFSAVGTFVHDTLVKIGQFFVSLWDSIVTNTGNFFSTLGTLAHNGLMLLLNGFLAPFRAIGALFVWLYNHNYYFKALVDTIRNLITSGLAWLRNAWTTAINWLVGLWHTVSGWASSTWTKTKNAIVVGVTAAVVWLQAQWDKATGWLSDKWNSFAGLASKAWQAVSGVFASIWGTYIAGPLGTLWNNFSSWFANLATQALQWGKNLIQSLINGITSMLGALGNAASNAAGAIAKFLGFHSPAKAGPGAELLDWPKNLIKAYAQGLILAIPQLQTALNSVMLPVQATLSGGISPSGVPTSNTSYASSHQTNFYINLSTMARSQSEVNNLVTLLEQELGRRVRLTTPGYNAGGVY